MLLTTTLRDLKPADDAVAGGHGRRLRALPKYADLKVLSITLR